LSLRLLRKQWFAIVAQSTATGIHSSEGRHTAPVEPSPLLTTALASVGSVLVLGQSPWLHSFVYQIAHSRTHQRPAHCCPARTASIHHSTIRKDSSGIPISSAASIHRSYVFRILSRLQRFNSVQITSPRFPAVHIPAALSASDLVVDSLQQLLSIWRRRHLDALLPVAYSIPPPIAVHPNAIPTLPPRQP
jgi:hypothetical protein